MSATDQGGEGVTDGGAMSEGVGDDSTQSSMRAYSTDEITVEWRAERCIHSGNCARSLPRVFNPRRRPWVDVSAAEADAIESAVRRCPSGALAFVRHGGTPSEGR